MKKAEKIARKQELEKGIEIIKAKIQECLAKDNLYEQIANPYDGSFMNFTWADSLRVNREALAKYTSELEKINRSLRPRSCKGSVYNSEKSFLDTIRVEGCVSGVRL